MKLWLYQQHGKQERREEGRKGEKRKKEWRRGDKETGRETKAKEKNET